MRLVCRPRANASSPSAVNPELLTKSPRDQDGLAADFAGERHQVGEPDLGSVPFGFDEVDLTVEPEAPVNLLAGDPERVPGRQIVGREEFVQEDLEAKSALLRRQLANLQRERGQGLSTLGAQPGGGRRRVVGPSSCEGCRETCGPAARVS